MITEIVLITIDPMRALDFEAAVASVVAAFRDAKGCLGMALEREIEDPGNYRLFATWENIDAHLIDFRNSDAFQVWRGAAGPFFTAPPMVVHSEAVARYF